MRASPSAGMIWQAVQKAPKASKRKPSAYIGTVGLRLRGKSKSPERFFAEKVENKPVFNFPSFTAAANPATKLILTVLGGMNSL